MKRLFISGLLIVSINSFAQNTSISKEDFAKEIQPLKATLLNLQKENKNLKTDVANLKLKLSDASSRIESLKNKTQENTSVISKTASDLGAKISVTENNTFQKFQEVDNSLSKNSLYAIIGVLSAILLSGILYFLLSKRQKTDKSEVVEKLNQTKISIEESLVKELGKQTNLIESELELLSRQKSESIASQISESDHSLALKLASEINLIERNINRMDKGTKGLKQLERSVGNLKDNLSANGYEMPVLLGKQYHQGMKVIVTSSLPDETLEKGSEIISKVLIPQVNFNDKMIQTAQIEVTIGI